MRTETRGPVLLSNVAFTRVPSTQSQGQLVGTSSGSQQGRLLAGGGLGRGRTPESVLREWCQAGKSTVNNRACNGHVGKHRCWKQTPGKAFSVMTFPYSVTGIHGPYGA